MSEPEKPSLATTELKLGGVTLKGSYIIWFAAIVSSAAGAVWAGGELWSDYKKLQENVAGIEIPDMKPVTVLTEKVDKIEKSLLALGAGLAAADSVGSKLGIDLKALQTIVDSNDVQKLQGAIATLRTTVDQLQASSKETSAAIQIVATEARASIQAATKELQTVREKMVGMESQMGVLKKDVDSQWNAIDSIGAGALKGR
jgi:polyhydroxyalkanoate synthesis regulator phasin